MPPAQSYVIVINNCTKPITVYVRRWRAKKPRRQKGSKGSFRLRPKQASPPVLYSRLVGARGWENLRSENCVKISDIGLNGPFVEVESKAPREISLRLRIPREDRPSRKRIKRVALKSRQTSHPVPLRAIVRTKEFKDLTSKGQVKLRRVAISRLPSVPAYWGDDEYICDNCGRPIVFRGYPPTPIHV